MKLQINVSKGGFWGKGKADFIEFFKENSAAVVNLKSVASQVSQSNINKVFRAVRLIQYFIQPVVNE